MINSAGLIIKHKEYYYLTGANFALDLQAQQGSNPLGILSLEEGGATRWAMADKSSPEWG